MKLKLFMFFSMLVLSIQLPAQTYKLIAVDSRQNRDTVIFGNLFSFDATVGVDAQLGESNIYGRPYNTLDIRSIQRDSLNHHCLVDQRWSHENLYFNQNLDMKIDYRQTYLDPWRVEPENRNYEFRINAENYPIYILGLSNGGTCDFYFTMLDSLCNVIQDTYLANNNFTVPDTLFVINNKAYNTILSFIMEPADVKQIEDEKFKIYPNPFSDKFKIENNEWTNFEFDIINITGTLIYKSGAVNKTTELNLSFLDKGLYYLRLTDGEKQVYIRKILKD